MDKDAMTVAGILRDPLIRQMMRADRVSPRQMKKLLEEAARGQRITQQRGSLSEAAGRSGLRQPR